MKAHFQRVSKRPVTIVHVCAFKVEPHLHKYHWSLPTGTQKPPCEASLFSLMTLHLGDIAATVIYAAAFQGAIIASA